MAIIKEIDQAALTEWAASRPQVIRDLIAKCPPDRLYLLKTSSHRVTLRSYCENGTVTVTGEYNRVLFSRYVFAVNPDDLEECELPSADEDVGDTSAEAGYSQEDVENILIPKLRANGGK